MARGSAGALRPGRRSPATDWTTPAGGGSAGWEVFLAGRGRSVSPPHPPLHVSACCSECLGVVLALAEHGHVGAEVRIERPCVLLPLDRTLDEATERAPDPLVAE